MRPLCTPLGLMAMKVRSVLSSMTPTDEMGRYCEADSAGKRDKQKQKFKYFYDSFQNFCSLKASFTWIVQMTATWTLWKISSIVFHGSMNNMKVSI